MGTGLERLSKMFELLHCCVAADGLKQDAMGGATLLPMTASGRTICNADWPVWVVPGLREQRLTGSSIRETGLQETGYSRPVPYAALLPLGSSAE